MAFYICLGTFVLSYTVNFVFYAFEYKTHSIVHAVFAAGLKHVWGVVVSVIILGSSQKVGWFAPSIMNHSFFRFMGRISYATYILHLLVIKLVMVNVHEPNFLSHLNTVSLTATQSIN